MPPKNTFKVIFLVLFAAGLFSLSPPVFSQEKEEAQLEKLEKEIEESRARERELEEKAERTAREAREISERLVQKAAEIRELESQIEDNETEIFEMTSEIAEKGEEIRIQNKGLTKTLAALQRLSQRPPQYILMHPAEAVETVRSASLLRVALPEIRERTTRIREDLGKLNDMKSRRVDAQQDLRANLETLQTQQMELQSLHNEKQALFADYTQGAKREKERATALAREARDLQSLIEKLETERQKAAPQALPTPSFPSGASFSSARGNLPFPVRGKVTQNFGDTIPAGKAKGIRIQTRAGTPVISPFDGRVIFAGPFRAYGQLLIIAHGDGYHSLLAGLQNIDTVVGQWLLAGEPVGTMPRTRVASSGNESVGSSPELYLEIRKEGEPVNPLPWLNGK